MRKLSPSPPYTLTPLPPTHTMPRQSARDSSSGGPGGRAPSRATGAALDRAVLYLTWLVPVPGDSAGAGCDQSAGQGGASSKANNSVRPPELGPNNSAAAARLAALAFMARPEFKSGLLDHVAPVALNVRGGWVHAVLAHCLPRRRGSRRLERQNVYPSH